MKLFFFKHPARVVYVWITLKHAVYSLAVLLNVLSLHRFTCRVQNMVSSSMRAKVAAYSLALILHMNHMMADLTLLHRDLGITEAR